MQLVPDPFLASLVKKAGCSHSSDQAGCSTDHQKTDGYAQSRNQSIGDALTSSGPPDLFIEIDVLCIPVPPRMIQVNTYGTIPDLDSRIPLFISLFSQFLSSAPYRILSSYPLTPVYPLSSPIHYGRSRWLWLQAYSSGPRVHR